MMEIHELFRGMFLLQEIPTISMYVREHSFFFVVMKRKSTNTKRPKCVVSVRQCNYLLVIHVVVYTLTKKLSHHEANEKANDEE